MCFFIIWFDLIFVWDCAIDILKCFLLFLIFIIYRIWLLNLWKIIIVFIKFILKAIKILIVEVIFAVQAHCREYSCFFLVVFNTIFNQFSEIAILILNIYKLLIAFWKIIWRWILLILFNFKFLISRLSQKLFIWHLILIWLWLNIWIFNNSLIFLVSFCYFKLCIYRSVVLHIGMMWVFRKWLKVFWNSYYVLGV